MYPAPPGICQQARHQYRRPRTWHEGACCTEHNACVRQDSTRRERRRHSVTFHMACYLSVAICKCTKPSPATTHTTTRLRQNAASPGTRHPVFGVYFTQGATGKCNGDTYDGPTYPFRAPQARKFSPIGESCKNAGFPCPRVPCPVFVGNRVRVSQKCSVRSTGCLRNAR